MESLINFSNYLWLITKIVLMLVLLMSILKVIIDRIRALFLIKKLEKLSENEEED